MKSELNFKKKTDGLQWSEGKKDQELTVPKKKNKKRYAELLKQKKNASVAVEYIEKGSDRRKHVFAFADKYRPVSAKECKNFYKKNPEEFQREKNESLMYGSVGAVLTCLTVGGLEWLGSPDNFVKFILMASIAFATIIPLLVCVLGWGDWLYMTVKGVANHKASADDFLKVFAFDKNLKRLCFKKSDKRMVLSGKSYMKRGEDFRRIIAYQETRRWLQQWSGGDLKRLHKVEWQALCGIAKKYGKYLTPVDSDRESSVSKI